MEGDLYITGNDLLSDLSALEGLTYIGGDLDIIWNSSLEDLSAFEGLTYIGGKLSVISNDNLIDCSSLGICIHLANGGDAFISNGSLGVTAKLQCWLIAMISGKSIIPYFTT